MNYIYKAIILKLCFVLVFCSIYLTGCHNKEKTNENVEYKNQISQNKYSKKRNQNQSIQNNILNHNETFEHEIYVYRNTFNNPCVRNQNNKLVEDEKENIKDNIKRILPFKLKGILHNGITPFALIQTSDSIKIVKKQDVIKNFVIIKVLTDYIIVEYKPKKLRFSLDIGGNFIEKK